MSNDVWKLERHAYAPELNKLHLVDGRVLKTPGCLDIPEACEYAEKHKLFDKKIQLIEKVEKAVQDEGINHGEILRADRKMFSVQELDTEGNPCGAFLVVVMPNETMVGIYKLDKLINI